MSTPSTLGGTFSTTLPACGDAFAAVPQLTVYEGSLGAGATAALAGHVAELVGQGADPADVLVLCATPAAAAAFAERLGRLIAPSAACQVRTTTPRAFALDVLADPGAQAATGRRPRVLCPFEADILAAELQPLGVAPDRLEQILLFLERSWSDLAHRDPAWLVTYEERAIIGALEAAQGATGALTAVQVVPLVVDYLAGCPEARRRAAAAHVVLDDMLAQPRAAQVLASLVARESLAVAADPGACTVAVEPYPCATGLDELLAANPGARRVALGAGPGDARCIEVAGVSVQAVCMTVEERAFCDPFAEFEAVAALVREGIGAGIAPGDACVVAPHPTWRANLAIALEDAGVAVHTLPDAGCLAVDFRDDGANAALRAFALLQLAADPCDPVALRTWGGLGDHFARASAFAAVYRLMDETGAGLAETLAGLAGAQAAPSQARVAAETCARGRALAEGLSAHLRGRELVNRAAQIAAQGCPGASPDAVGAALLELCGPVGSDDTASELVERALRAATAPAFPRMEEPGQDRAVRLCGLDDAYGMAPRLLVAAGCMDGFVPTPPVFQDTTVPGAVRERLLAAQTHRLQSLLAHAQTAVVTYTTSLPSANADLLGLETARLRLRNGERVALLARSACLG